MLLLRNNEQTNWCHPYIYKMARSKENQLCDRLAMVVYSRSHYVRDNDHVIYLSAGEVCGQYSDWGPCSIPCGAKGLQERTRVCITKVNGHDTERVTVTDVRPCFTACTTTTTTTTPKPTTTSDGEPCGRPIRNSPVKLLSEIYSSLNEWYI